MNDFSKSQDELLAELASLRQRCEQLLEEKQNIEQRTADRWRSIVSNTPVFFAVVDRDATITFLNRAQPGTTPDEAVGRSTFDYTHPDYHDILRTCLENAFEQGKSDSFISVAAGPNGASAWYETYVSPVIVDQQITSATLIALDITPRQQAEQAVNQARNELEQCVEKRTAQLVEANQRLASEIEERHMADAQLRAIYNGMVDGLLIADSKTRRFLRANTAISEMLGYSLDELRGMTVSDIHPPSDVPRIVQVFVDYAQTDPNGPATMVADNLPILRKDGTIFYADVTASHIVYGGVPCVLGFFRDSTDRKESRERLQREHRLLQELLRSQDRERQLIAYEIHDGLAQQLVGAIMQFDAVVASATHNPEQALASCEAGLTMLRKSLAEARRLIAGLRPPILDELGVVAAIGHIVHDVPAEGGPQIEYSCQVQFDRLAPVLENTIYRTTQECLNNAVRHSQSEKVQIELVQEEDMLRINVTDWGIGFDSTEERAGCFGLEGIRQRARLLGGSVTVHSQPGQGTRVQIELPLPSETGDSTSH